MAKKIGILTYQRAENYGALLQAYALKSFLKGLNYSVSFVDYWPDYHVEHYKLFSLSKFKKMTIVGKVKYICHFLLWGIPKHVRKYHLTRFMHQKLKLEKKITYKNGDVTEHYDVVIYGSDQIWRRQDIHHKEFNPWYFGSSNVLAEKKIAYAASMGILKTSKEEDEWVQQQMKNFDAISVREQDLCLYLNELGFHPQVVCDPTFLLSKDEWKKLFNPIPTKQKYILFYNLLQSEESVKFAEELSHSTGLPIREINMNLTFSHFCSNRYITSASLERFLQLVDGAEYVVSNSFHGVALSLIFEKQFFAVGMANKSNRVVSLLQIVGLEDRYITKITCLPSLSIDYRIVKEKMDKMIMISSNFLKSNLEK